MFQINRKTAQNITTAFLIIIAACCSGYGDIKEAYAYLKQNRAIILNAFSRCHPWSSPLYSLPCNFIEIDRLKMLLENNSVNDSIMELTVRGFQQKITSVSTLLSNRRTGVIIDSISITFLTKLINGSSVAYEKECGLAIDATYDIMRRVSYPSLHKYKNQINAAVMNSCAERSLKRDVSILTGPDESQRRALLKELEGATHPEFLPDKARLGDTVAIETIRANYQNAKHYGEKKPL